MKIYSENRVVKVSRDFDNHLATSATFFSHIWENVSKWFNSRLDVRGKGCQGCRSVVKVFGYFGNLLTRYGILIYSKGCQGCQSFHIKSQQCNNGVKIGVKYGMWGKYRKTSTTSATFNFLLNNRSVTE